MQTSEELNCEPKYKRPRERDWPFITRRRHANASTGYTEYTDAATHNQKVAASLSSGGSLRRSYLRERCAAIELNLSFIALTRAAPLGATAISFSRLARNCGPANARNSSMKSSSFAHTA